jgi:hypothetical protein
VLHSNSEVLRTPSCAYDYYAIWNAVALTHSSIRRTTSGRSTTARACFAHEFCFPVHTRALRAILLTDERALCTIYHAVCSWHETLDETTAGRDHTVMCSKRFQMYDAAAFFLLSTIAIERCWIFRFFFSDIRYTRSCICCRMSKCPRKTS